MLLIAACNCSLKIDINFSFFNLNSYYVCMCGDGANDCGVSINNVFSFSVNGLRLIYTTIPAVSVQFHMCI